MTTLEKLAKLYSIKDKLCPLTNIVVVGLSEDKIARGFTLKQWDIDFIEEVWPEYESLLNV